MARTCTICAHPKLVNIDRQLLRGDMLNSIAHRFHVSPDAVGRHRRHMRTAMLKAQAASEKQDLVYGQQPLIDEVKAIKADRGAFAARRPAGHPRRTAYYGGIDPRTGQPDAKLPDTFDRKIVSVDCALLRNGSAVRNPGKSAHNSAHTNCRMRRLGSEPGKLMSPDQEVVSAE